MGFYTTCLHVRLRNLRTSHMLFFHEEELFSLLTTCASGSEKRNHDNSGHLLMRAVAPKKKIFFCFVLSHSLTFRLKRGCVLRKLRVSFQIGQCCKYQPIRNEHALEQLLSPGGERGKPDGLFHPRFQ